MTQQQIDVIRDTIGKWPKNDILATVGYILHDCDRFPTPADWHRLRPTTNPEPPPGNPIASLDDIPINPDDIWWWKSTLNALKAKGRERIAILQQLIIEAQKRNMPEFQWVEREVSRHTNSRGQLVSTRSVTNIGWARWKTEPNGKIISANCVRPDRHVIIKP